MAYENVEDEKIQKLQRDVTVFLGPYEPIIMNIQSLLVWEKPFRSAASLSALLIIIWFIFSASSSFFFLWSIFLMILVVVDTWKNKIWPEIRVPPTEPEDTIGWTPVHPRLLSVPELSHHLSRKWVRLVKFLQSAWQCRSSHPLVFCLGNTVFFSTTAIIGYYISGFMLCNILFITVMLWPSILYHSLLKKLCAKLQPIFLWVQNKTKNTFTCAITIGGKIRVLKARFIKENPTIEINEDEDFVPQVDSDIAAALAKAMTDSEEDGGNSSIPTPRLSKNPSFSTSEDEAPEIDFDLNINQMPSFDDLENSDDELNLTTGSDNNLTHFRRGLYFSPSHFKETSSDEEEFSDFQNAGSTASNAKASSGSQMASTLAKTISTMIESAMQGAVSLDEGQSARSSSLNPHTGSKLTYTRTDRGESIDFLNPEPSISESDEDAEEEDHIAEIEKDFDFLSELDPENDQ